MCSGYVFHYKSCKSCIWGFINAQATLQHCGNVTTCKNVQSYIVSHHVHVPPELNACVSIGGIVLN